VMKGKKVKGKVRRAAAKAKEKKGDKFSNK